MAFELTPVGIALAKIAQQASFLKSRYSDNESKLLLLHFENSSLDAKVKAFDLYQENVALKLKIKELETGHSQEIANLKDQVQKEIAAIKSSHTEAVAKVTASHAKPREEELEDVAKQMLLTLANNDPNNSITDSELIQLFQIPQAQGDYFFAQLRERKLVASAGGQMGRGMYWHVTDTGLKYLKECGLLGSPPQKTIAIRRSSGAFRVGRGSF